jgi:hypothetical protein
MHQEKQERIQDQQAAVHGRNNNERRMKKEKSKIYVSRRSFLHENKLANKVLLFSFFSLLFSFVTPHSLKNKIPQRSFLIND